MIIRIATEGQYRVEDSDVAALNELDNEAVDACGSRNEESFHTAYERLLSFVRDRGTPLGEEEIVASELILPPPDVTLEEASAEFTGEGLIPG